MNKGIESGGGFTRTASTEGRVNAAAASALKARRQAADAHRRAAALHGRAADFYSDHAERDRRAGNEQLAVEMEERATREQACAADELRRAEIDEQP